MEWGETIAPSLVGFIGRKWELHFRRLNTHKVEPLFISWFRGQLSRTKPFRPFPVELGCEWGFAPLCRSNICHWKPARELRIR